MDFESKLVVSLLGASPHCATVYLTKETDVAFRPFGLDLFDKLSDACEAVRKELEKERKELEALQLPIPELPEGTTAHKLLSSITSLTKPEKITELGTLSDADRERIEELRKRLQDLQTDDPEKASQILTLRATRLGNLCSHLTKLGEVLADQALKSISEAREAFETGRQAAEALRVNTFLPSLLPGTGSDLWRKLWEAARRFSVEKAYPSREFPVTGEDALCLLCQQPIGDDASSRLKHFERFLRSTLQQELDRATAKYQEHHLRLSGLSTSNDTIRATVEELRLDDEELAQSVGNFLEEAQQCRDEVLKALQDTQPLPSGLSEVYAEQVSREAQALRDRAEQLLRNVSQEVKTKLSSELQELEARQKLSENIQPVLNEIERQKKLLAYRACVRDTNTKSITDKSTELTTRAVTQHLTKSFKGELAALRFTHLEVEMQATRGIRGALYHKLVMKRAEGIDLPSVVSEGEATCLSIAAFFSELSTASDRSAIIFDDPVSSLDQRWRENVARRLAEEAQLRQVVVFTHDIVFLLTLARFAEDLNTPCKHQYLRREAPSGAGLVSPDLPWVAMKVKDRIGVMKQICQSADKLYRVGAQDKYEHKAVYIYGMLREAWERGLEEILLGGLVERYRPTVQTQQVKLLSDITEDDCQALEAGMTKCPRWLRGHDLAAAENPDVPDPDELRSDIDALDSWRMMIVRRRNK